MKTHERLILGCFVSVVALLTWGATVGVEIRPTPFTVRMMTNATASSTATYLGVPTLSGTNVFTGTIVATNPASIVGGDGSRLTGMGSFRQRILFKTNDVFIPSLMSVGTSATFTTTNFAYIGGNVSTNLFNLTLPPLMSTNSKVGYMSVADRTNGLSANCFFDVVLGTNLATSSVQFMLNTTPRQLSQTQTPFGGEFFRNIGSFTVQIANLPSAALTAAPVSTYIPASYFDTSVPWTMSIGALPNTQATPSTNIFLREFMIVEQWEVQ